MLQYLLYPLASDFSVFNVFRYISFRAMGAAATAIIISLIIGPWLIQKLKLMSFGQVVREEGPATHKKKAGTPTMGGTLILFSLFISMFLWMDFTSVSSWIVLFVTLAYGILGFWDDYKKIVLKNTKGVSARGKLLFQIVVAGITCWLFHTYGKLDTQLHFPFLKTFTIDLGWFYIPFCMCVIVGSSNAVNLTDGLDGLAIGSVIITLGTFALLTYLAGNVKFAEYLDIPYVAGVGELAVFCAATVAAGLGFLWFNAYPAQVFMGDVGSLALGGAIGTLAVATKNELLLIVLGGLFVVEALSVMIQVFVFKRTGKRVFRMAPIHHHFEIKGIPESKITVRFWIISILLAILALSTLKLR